MRKDIAGAIQLTKTIVTAVVAQVTSPLAASLTCHQRSKLGFFRVLVESVTRSPCMLVEFHSPIIVPCHAHHVPLLLLSPSAGRLDQGLGFPWGVVDCTSW